MKILLPALLLLQGYTASAQPVYKNIPFAEARQLARVNGKVILLQLESADCDECNEVADKGMSDNEVVKKIEEAFIPIKISARNPDRDAIAMQYNIPETGFGTLFIDMNGALLLKFLRSTTFAQEYKNQLDLALYSLGESERINYLEKQYQDGDRNIDFLETFITKKRTLRLNTDTLLETYVQLLPEDSLRSLRTLVFIAQMAPMLDSKAYSLMYKDPKLFQAAWYTLSAPVRIGINNAIIYKGISKAIIAKDLMAALRTASLARAVNGSNITEGDRAFDRNMLSYYQKADPVKYFDGAVEYYNRYYMVVTKDSIARMDSARREKLYSEATARDTVVNGKTVKRRMISYAPVGQYYSNELNRAAWNFYTMTSDPALLSTATEWAIRSILLFKKPGALDTYARLLYKQGQKEKAIEIETEARSMWLTQKFPAKGYDRVLDKMKNNLPLD